MEGPVFVPMAINNSRRAVEGGVKWNRGMGEGKQVRDVVWWWKGLLSDL